MSISFYEHHPLVKRFGSREMVRQYIRSHTRRELMDELNITKFTVAKYQQVLDCKCRPECNKCRTTDEANFKRDSSGKVPNGLCVDCSGPPRRTKQTGDAQRMQLEYDEVRAVLEAARKPMSSAQGGLSYWARMGEWMTDNEYEMEGV